MMKQYCIQRIAGAAPAASEVVACLDREDIALEAIGEAPWVGDYPYRPQAWFRLAHDGERLLVHYHVVEEAVRAMAAADNGKVWEDSCCELFVTLPGDNAYYNIECNCAGRLLVGYGADRNKRVRAPQAVLDRVDRWSSLGRAAFDTRHAPQGKTFTWDLCLVIPRTTFFKNGAAGTCSQDGGLFAGHPFRANVYKCGDALPHPHFLSWNPIGCPTPDFHRPQDFGTMVVE